MFILFDPRARIPLDKATGKSVHRAQDRIDHLVKALGKEKTKIIIPAPALAEFMLLANDKWDEYLTIIRRKALFEIAGFADPEAVALVEYCQVVGGKLKAKQPGMETWAKLKYDLQIAAIAKTRRVEAIYSTDKDLRRIAERLSINFFNLADLPLPPAIQLPLKETVDGAEQGTTPSPDNKSDFASLRGQASAG